MAEPEDVLDDKIADIFTNGDVEDQLLQYSKEDIVQAIMEMGESLAYEILSYLEEYMDEEI